MSWQTVLGFEVHIELATASKMFCGCPADHFGKPPNSQTCPVCLGLPGALPVPNIKAIEWCIKLGLALDCQINLFSKFDRKNYFYPDLPKGYQISQYDQPFCHSGSLSLASGKIIRITRVHLEEDTGKLQHATVNQQKVSLIDFNRSGVPLVEIVTEPDFSSSGESDEFLKEIQQIVRVLKISTADMEKGSMRLEANISVRPTGQEELPKFKVEVKNVNSFRFIKKAVDFEVSRQIRLLESGTIPPQETRGFNESTGETFSQRGKEEAHDYRYFPEPDIPPLKFTGSQINRWKKSLPELPSAMRNKLVTKFSLSLNNASIISYDANMYKIFTQAAATGELPPVTLANALINKRYGNTLPRNGHALIRLLKTQAPVITDEQTIASVRKIISSNPKAVTDLKSGKNQSLFFIIGQIKKELGNIDIPAVTKIIQQEVLVK